MKPKLSIRAQILSRMWWYFGFFLAFLLLFPLYILWQVMHPQKYVSRTTPEDLAWTYESVALTTEDGLSLSSWFVPSGKSSDKIIILLHGYPADKGDLLYWAGFLHDDFNLLFFDFRYFGQSQGEMTTLGFREQKDLKAAVSFAKSKGFDKIGVMGFSMGGAIAIVGSAREDSIRAVVSDSSFANFDLMGQDYYRQLHFLKYPLTFLTKIWAKSLFGIDAAAIAPDKAAGDLKLPILIIHSRGDTTISFENALRLQMALAGNQKAQFLFFDRGVHGAVSGEYLEEYRKTVLEFFGKNLR